jgi:hypothetical protein
LRKSEGIAARLPEPVIDELNKIAAEEDRSLSQVVNRGLRFYIEHRAKLPVPKLMDDRK